MSPWFWILVGAVVGTLSYIAAFIAFAAVRWFASWIFWKRRQIRCRREWTQENPYWREAFDAGAKWAREGESRAEPNLTRLRMPGGKDES